MSAEHVASAGPIQHRKSILRFFALLQALGGAAFALAQPAHAKDWSAITIATTRA